MGMMLSRLRCSSQPTPPCSAVASVSLPPDAIFDILSWLPLKSLCRFRCVSREWRALISDPAFIAAHKARSEPLIATKSFSEPTTLRLTDMDGNVAKLINTRDHIYKFVCTSSDNIICAAGYFFQQATVINIATGEIFVTSIKGTFMGFGRATPSGVYKMVCIHPRSSSILTIGDGAGWRQKQFPPPKGISYHSSPIAVNGMLYFASQLHGDSVLCFDLESEEWKRGIKGPPGVEPKPCHITLGELNSTLCMMQPEVDNGFTTIWLLTNADKGTWFKLYTIPLDPSTYDRMIPLRMLLDGGKLLFYVTYDSMKLPMLQIFDPQHRTCSDAPKILAGSRTKTG
ncbi:putative F-box/kelch-repeat protein At1g12870 [Lolium rigidum]|uniref:putative F-box/kelch-repeat protein At1g12870 n=1 Tax=Lolium rigidum TaxID=89674 RepID=UPI001F5C2754|nr:putative F-box/kelch-repeat protein At1g12870 [Lolium rigidum]